MRLLTIVLSTFLIILSMTIPTFAMPVVSIPANPIPLKTIPSAKLNLNQATEKELLKIKGLSKSNIHAILNFHKKHGDFHSIDDLKKINSFKKMKPAHLKSIQDQLIV